MDAELQNLQKPLRYLIFATKSGRNELATNKLIQLIMPEQTISIQLIMLEQLIQMCDYLVVSVLICHLIGWSSNCLGQTLTFKDLKRAENFKWVLYSIKDYFAFVQTEEMTIG